MAQPSYSLLQDSRVDKYCTLTLTLVQTTAKDEIPTTSYNTLSKMGDELLWLKNSDANVENLGPEFVWRVRASEPLVRERNRSCKTPPYIKKQVRLIQRAVSALHTEDRAPVELEHPRVRRTYDQPGGRFNPATSLTSGF